MEVNSTYIQELFNLLLTKKISREQGQMIASEIRDKFDTGNLQFISSNEEDVIWDALEFLELFAQKIDENTYLYSDEDLVCYMEDNNWTP